MSTHFVNILRQASKTFDIANHAVFAVNFATLKQLTDRLTYRDLGLSEKNFLNDGTVMHNHMKGRAAPCTFINILENDFMSLSVFIIQGGYTMPLHDHPQMHGILRGIYGKLRIQSYTRSTKSPSVRNQQRDTNDVLAHAEEPVLIDTSTGCAVLTPDDRNYHEITALGGVAAFFDILSPPYLTDIPGYGPRRCRFYSAYSLDLTTDRTLCRLVRIASPKSYFCDTQETPNSVIECTTGVGAPIELLMK